MEQNTAASQHSFNPLQPFDMVGMASDSQSPSDKEAESKGTGAGACDSRSIRSMAADGEQG